MLGTGAAAVGGGGIGLVPSAVVPASLNHTVVYATDARASATFLSEILDLPAPVRAGPFWQVDLDNGVSLDYADASEEKVGELPSLHLAFLVGEEQFDATYARITERRIEHFADPRGKHPNEINTHDGGRGVYWPDPDGHWLEMITVPYGGWRR